MNSQQTKSEQQKFKEFEKKPRNNGAVKLTLELTAKV